MGRNIIQIIQALTGTEPRLPDWTYPVEEDLKDIGFGCIMAIIVVLLISVLISEILVNLNQL